ncbi:hypothetical protein OKW41_002311 [Paraburkholderia sp. UCT70]
MLLLQKHATIGRSDPQAAVVAADALGRAFEQQCFVVGRVGEQPELQR